jgi:hypothetical protein
MTTKTIYVDVLIYAVLGVLLFCAELSGRRYWYYMGYEAQLGDYMLLAGSSFVLVSVVSVVLLCIRFVRRLRKDRIMVVSLRAVSLAIWITAAGYVLFSSEPHIVNFMEGFRDRMLAEADVASIREWALENQQNLWWKSNSVVPASNWPQCILRLSPRDVIIEKDQGKKWIVRLFWGTGFMHWGIDIGPPEMPTPTSGDELVMQLQSGVYVWSY